MKESNPGSSKQGKDRAKELADMLDRTLSEPGIHDVMPVYENWKRFDAAAQPHRQVMAVVPLRGKTRAQLVTAIG